MAYDDDTLWLAQDFTEEKSRIGEKIIWREIRLMSGGKVVFPEAVGSLLVTGGIVSPHRALYEAARHLEKTVSPERRRVILVLETDIPTPTRTQLRGMYRHPLPSKKGTLSKDEILKHLLTVRATVCALIATGYRTADWARILKTRDILTKPLSVIIGYNPWDHASVEFYVERTGGEARIVNSENVVAQLEELIERLYLRYSLGYVPSNSKRDGKFRKIRVTVSSEVERREGGVIIKAREGYYAPREEGRR
jgi:hypothetical protein